MLLRVERRQTSHRKLFMSSEDDRKQVLAAAQRRCAGWLTLSERQAGTGLEAVAEQSEGLRGGGVGKVDHLQAALQKQLVTQVEQMLLLHADAGLSRHLFEEALHPGGIETQNQYQGSRHAAPIRIHAHLFSLKSIFRDSISCESSDPELNLNSNLLLLQFISITRLVTDSLGSTRTFSVL